MGVANYCLACGTYLETRNINQVDRKACPECDFVFWGNYSIGVGALIIKDNKILLVRRSQNPGRGLWTNPGGYIEQFERIEETIKREVFEETGISSKVNGIIALGDFPKDVHNVYIVFLMDYLEGDPRPDNVEVDDAGFYTLDEMESMNISELTRQLATIAFQEPKFGLIANPIPLTTIPGYRVFNIHGM